MIVCDDDPGEQRAAGESARESCSALLQGACAERRARRELRRAGISVAVCVKLSVFVKWICEPDGDGRDRRRVAGAQTVRRGHCG